MRKLVVQQHRKQHKRQQQRHVASDDVASDIVGVGDVRVSVIVRAISIALVIVLAAQQFITTSTGGGGGGGVTVQQKTSGKGGGGRITTTNATTTTSSLTSNSLVSRRHHILQYYLQGIQFTTTNNNTAPVAPISITNDVSDNGNINTDGSHSHNNNNNTTIFENGAGGERIGTDDGHQIAASSAATPTSSSTKRISCEDLHLDPDELEFVYLDHDDDDDDGDIAKKRLAYHHPNWNPTHVSNLPQRIMSGLGSSGSTSDDHGCDEIQYAFCMLDRYNTVQNWIRKNIAHAAQWFIPCFSFVERIRETHPNVQMGFWYNDFDVNPTIKMMSNNWLHVITKYYIRRPNYFSICERHTKFDMIKYYNAKNQSMNYSASTAAAAATKTLAVIRRDNLVVYRPPTNAWKGVGASGSWWFGKHIDAISFQNRIAFDDDDNDNTNSNNNNKYSVIGNTTTIRIGLVQRKHTRKITNIDDLQRKIHDYYHNSDNASFDVVVQVDQASMEDMTPIQQATWFHTRNIVVAVHGAALANTIFMMPTSSSSSSTASAAVIEIFPLHFYEPDYFRLLSQSMSINHYQWTHSNVSHDPLSDYHYHLQNTPRIRGGKTTREILMSNDVTVDVDEIMVLVQTAMNAILIKQR
jgi:Glycosyltransferase 61